MLPAVAVLPLQNLDPSAGTDYLRVALADEVATILSHTTRRCRPPVLHDQPLLAAAIGSLEVRSRDRRG